MNGRHVLIYELSCMGHMTRTLRIGAGGYLYDRIHKITICIYTMAIIALNLLKIILLDKTLGSNDLSSLS